MRIYRLLLIFRVCLFTLPASAQDADDSNGRELRLLAWAPSDTPLFLGSGKEAITIALSIDQFTLIKGKQVPRGQTVEIFAEVPDLQGKAPQQIKPATSEAPAAPPEEVIITGPTKRISYATGTWPAGSRRALGFLAPEGDGSVPHGKLILLPDSPTLHPEHSMRLINLTEVPLGIRLGDKKARVPVRGDLICPFDPGRLRIDIAVNENEKWNVVTGTNLATASHYRCFALIRPQVNPNPLFPSDQPDIQSIFEQTSPLPKHPPLPIPPASTPRAADASAGEAKPTS